MTVPHVTRKGSAAAVAMQPFTFISDEMKVVESDG